MFGIALEGTKRDVALAALEPANIGAVNPKQVGKGLLRQTASQPVPADVGTEYPLEVAFHDGQRRSPLLEGLQTYR